VKAEFKTFQRRNEMTKKVLSIFVVVLVVILLCVAGYFIATKVVHLYNLFEANLAPVATQAPAPVQSTTVVCEPIVAEPVVPALVCDPSTVVFTDMGELDSAVVTTIKGPAIYEWWTGGSNEGVQRVGEGSIITIHGVKGHWWVLPSQDGLDCAWELHVSNYGAKPQHEGKTYDQLVVPPPAKYLK
jgi:hypothetical protein